MSTPVDTDIYLVNRGGSSFTVIQENIMAELQDTDLLLVNRGALSYKITGADFKDSVLTPVNPVPGSISSAPAFQGGTGTQADPFVLATSLCMPAGSNVNSTESITITVPGAQEGQPVTWINNSVGSAERFDQPGGSIGANGLWTGHLVYDDTPATTVDQIYAGSLQIGTCYFTWDVNQIVSNIVPPVINSVTLVETNPGAPPRFTVEPFVLSTSIDDGIPNSVKTIDAFVDGTISEVVQFEALLESSTPIPGAETAIITGMTPGGTGEWSLYFDGNTDLDEFNVGDVVVSNPPAASGTVTAVDPINYWRMEVNNSTGTWANGSTVVGPSSADLTFPSGTDMTYLAADDAVIQSVYSSECIAVGGSFASDGGPELMFDGDITTFSYVTANDSSIIWTIDPAQLDLAGKAFTFNSTSATATVALYDANDTLKGNGVTAGYQLWSDPINIPSTGDPVTKVVVNCPTQYGQMSAFAVDGQILVQASGIAQSITGTSVALSTSSGTWVDGDGVTGPTKTIPIHNTRKYLNFNQSGAVSDLLDAPQDPPYTTSDTDPGLTFTFPAFFPSGLTPDEELGEGTTITASVVADNGVSVGPVNSNIVQPSDTPVPPETDVITHVDTTTTGTPWVPATAPEVNPWNSIAYGNGTFVALSYTGTNRVMYSTDDALTWTAASASESNSWQSVAYGDNKFVAVSSNGTNQVMYSADGISWTAASASAFKSWRGITYGDGKFVAVGVDNADPVMYSADGINWTSASVSVINSFTRVTYGGGKFVATANGGTGAVMYSTDAITWTIVDAAENNSWMSVTYGDGTFVAVASYAALNRVMYSSDGITWTATPAASDIGWLAVTYGDGKFVAVAGDGTDRAMWSADGITWESAPGPESNEWFAITYGNGKFVSVGSSGTNRVMWSTSGTGEVTTAVLTLASDKELGDFNVGDPVESNPAAATGTVFGIDTSNPYKMTVSYSSGTWAIGSTVLGPLP